MKLEIFHRNTKGSFSQAFLAIVGGDADSEESRRFQIGQIVMKVKGLSKGEINPLMRGESRIAGNLTLPSWCRSR